MGAGLARIMKKRRGRPSLSTDGRSVPITVSVTPAMFRDLSVDARRRRQHLTETIRDNLKDGLVVADLKARYRP